MGYLRPTDAKISCSWQCHRNRNPPSTMPGTDYACAYNTGVKAADPGTITFVNTNPSGASGRGVDIRLDDGRTVAYIHLSPTIYVKVGQRVSRGQVVALSGASGYGKDWYYGPHVHVTLWAGVPWQSANIDFENYVGGGGGGGTPGPTQRKVGVNPANGRSQPNTQVPVTQTLDPGVLGNFNGWITGENVQGNSTWFRGSMSGDWFWSGGFTDTGVHDLANLNPVTPPQGNQRVVGVNPANGRSDPSTQHAPTQTLDPGTLANMNGWINGEVVQSNPVWFRGEFSGDWFWSGGFTDTGTHDLTDLNTVAPVPAARVVAINPANVRAAPYTSSPAIASEDPATVVPMRAWTAADTVQDIDVWFQREVDGNWMWAGGFTSQSCDGLPESELPPNPTSPDNPRGLPEYDPIYPEATKGLMAPLGFHENGEPALRTSRGSNPPIPTAPIIDRYIIHHTGTTADQLDYFSYRNDRSSCPTWYMRTDGSVFEMIRPAYKPAATGSAWNWRSVAVETLNVKGAPGWDVTDAQKERHAQIIAWLAEYNGTTLDGVPVEFTIDRVHVISHLEALPGQTACPGPDLQGSLDAIVARAKEIYAENHPDPNPDPDDFYLVPVALGNQIRRLVELAFPERDETPGSGLPNHPPGDPRNG